MKGRWYLARQVAAAITPQRSEHATPMSRQSGPWPRPYCRNSATEHAPRHHPSNLSASNGRKASLYAALACHPVTPRTIPAYSSWRSSTAATPCFLDGQFRVAIDSPVNARVDHAALERNGAPETTRQRLTKAAAKAALSSGDKRLDHVWAWPSTHSPRRRSRSSPSSTACWRQSSSK